MKVGCWNIQGLNTKTHTVPIEVEKCKLDIVVLSETKKKGSGDEILDKYLHFWSGVDKGVRAQAGVSILIKKEFKHKIKNWRFINERIHTFWQRI